MTIQDFTAIAASYGMLTVDSLAFGELRGYPFTIAAKDPQIRNLTVSFKLAQKLTNQTLKHLRNQLQGIGRVFRFSSDPYQVGITCAGQDQEVWNRLFTAMNLAVQEFQAAGLTIPQSCPICKKSGCDSLAYVGNGYVPVHKHCCEQKSFGTMEKAEVNEHSGHYWSGILGAILGGTIAAIPTICTIYFMEMLYAILYALIPLGAYYGYRLCRGRMNKAVLPVVIGVAVLELFFVQQVTWYLALHDAYGIWPSVYESIVCFTVLVSPGDMIADLLKPALFTALGILISYNQIHRTNQTDVKVADLTLRSLFVKAASQPGTGAQPDQPQNTGFNG